MLVNVWWWMSPLMKRRVAQWPSFLYLFDADSNSVWTPPADIVSEDASDAYEIVDAWGDLWKGLRKKAWNTATKWALFNSGNVFEVPVVVSYEFYMTNTASFTFAFWTNLTLSLNTGGRVVGFLRDASTGNAKHNWRRANTLSDFLTSDWWCLDLVGGGYDYKIPLSTWVLYIAEVWRDQTTGKQRIRVSADQWVTRYNTCEHTNTWWQSRVGFVDWVWMSGQVHLKRVEVLPLAV